MADPVAPTPIEAAIAAAPAPSTAPAVPVAAPAVPASAPAAPPAEAAPAPTPAPVTPAPATTPTPAPVAAPAEIGSLLSDAKPAATAAPAPVPAATPTAEPIVPAPLPTYEPFKAPEGVTLDDGVVGKFTEILGKYEADSKSDHAKMHALGQQFVDLYVSEQKRQQETLMENFNSMRDGWRKAVTADADLGAHNLPTTLAQAGALIEQYGGTPEQQAELRQVLKITGAGDHPAMVRLFRNAGKHLATEGKPVPATNPKNPAVLPKSQRRYPSLQNPNGAA